MPGGVRNLVYGELLWDVNGREWLRQGPADAATAEGLCGQSRAVGTYGADGTLRWLDGAECWSAIREGYGTTVTGDVWRSGADTLLAVRVGD